VTNNRLSPASRRSGPRVLVGVDDPQLIAELRRGDPRAFRLVYDRHRPRLFAFLVRLTRRRDLAEDLLQETWLRLASRAHGLEPDTSLRAWLFTVARNLFVSQRRFSLLDADRLASLRLLPAHALASPFEELSRDETERRLEAALARLALAQREVMLLVVVEGFTPSEVAAMLGLKPEAVRQRLARGRQALAASLAEAKGGGHGAT
jgi:RNA polymerase sigma factor (sigma-70 family)